MGRKPSHVLYGRKKGKGWHTHSGRKKNRLDSKRNFFELLRGEGPVEPPIFGQRRALLQLPAKQTAMKASWNIGSRRLRQI